MPGKILATTTILTYNSGKTLAQCLESVQDFDDILVCDGGSTDDTVLIAKKYGARVISQSDVPGPISNFTEVRQKTFKEAKYDWIFIIDSDEYADRELLNSIREIVSGNEKNPAIYKVNYFPVVENNVIKYSFFSPMRQLRFVNRQRIDWLLNKRVHEHMVPVRGVSIGLLNGATFSPWPEFSVGQKKDRYYLRLAFSKPVINRPTLIVTIRSVVKNLLQALRIILLCFWLSIMYRNGVLPWKHHMRFAVYHFGVARERVRQFVFGTSYTPPDL